MVRSVSGGKKTTYQYDPFGRRISKETDDPTRLLDESGKIVWAAQYDAWGKVKKLPIDEVEPEVARKTEINEEYTPMNYSQFCLLSSVFCLLYSIFFILSSNFCLHPRIISSRQLVPKNDIIKSSPVNHSSNIQKLSAINPVSRL